MTMMMTMMMTMGDHKRTHKLATKQKKCPACFLLVCLAHSYPCSSLSSKTDAPFLPSPVLRLFLISK